jgi:hypothetical protein
MKYALLVLALLATVPAFAQETDSKLYVLPEGPSTTVDGGNKVVTTTTGAFEIVMQAGLLKEKAPFTLVNDRAQADYTMSWDVQPAAYRTYIVTVSLNNRNGQVVWAGNAAGPTLNHCAEVIARHLKDAMKHKK